jgi:[protein-PII] uridylyltransferase
MASLSISFKEARTELLRGSASQVQIDEQGFSAADGPAGKSLVDALTSLTFSFLETVAASVVWDTGWSLAVVGGTGRRELCPGSDIDLLLLHPKRVTDRTVAALTEPLFYPLWDAGLTVTPGVHTIESAVALGEHEILSAATWMDVAHLAGDPTTTGQFTELAQLSRRKHSRKQVRTLIDITRERHARLGDVAFLLGPDLRDGHGGLRDLLVLRYLSACGFGDDESWLFEVDPSTLHAENDLLLGVRAELHRCTNRPHDVLALQEQDAVAARFGQDADELLGSVSAAARTIAWCTDETIRRTAGFLDKRNASRFGKALRLSEDIALQSGEVVLNETADPSQDPSLLVRVAAAAALNQLPISRSALLRLAAEAPVLPNPWPERARNALVAVLGSGAPAIAVIEALDRYGLMVRILPEWATVQAKPQRNAYHRFTVDRHLLQAAVNASHLVRNVARPDLLLIGTWLHDIGKGYPGDHTEVGMVLIADIARRMGYSEPEVQTLVVAVQHHLLIPETATRRDLSDPAVITNVARQVQNVDSLQLLRALTEADSLATGPTAWSPWKAQLCDDLVVRVERVLAGHRPPEPQAPAGPDTKSLLQQVREGKTLAVAVSYDERAPELTILTVAAQDRPGLFSALTGSLAVVGAEVLGADVWTTDDGIALDVLRITRRLGGETDLRRFEKLTLGALEGTIDLRHEVEKRAKSYARSQPTLVVAAPLILVDDDIEERATVVEVRAPDMLALLYRIATTLTGMGLDIRAAKVTTLGHEVVDSFSVVRVLPDGTRAKQSPYGPTNDEVRAALLAELQLD